MTKDEALDLAHGYLDRLIRGLNMDDTSEAVQVRDAIKQARSAPVQEPVAWGCNRYIEDDNGFQIGTDEPELAWGKYAPDDNGWWPLFTTPPAAQRQHVTDGNPCWCEPETSYTDPETGVSVIVHREPQ